MTLALFHFLRPAWLLAIVALVALWWIARRRNSQQYGTRTGLPSHLEQALVIDTAGVQRFGPIDLTCLSLLLGIIAVAGPTWKQVPAPWLAETTPVVIAIEVTDSMRSNDLLPTRLDRARLKVLDLIQARTGARTALIAYAGSAHIVIPPTRDADVIKPFIESLDPSMMPLAGNAVSQVLAATQKLMKDNGARSSLILMTDGIDRTDMGAIAEYVSNPQSPTLIIYLIGTESGGVALMPDGTMATNENGARVTTAVDRNYVQTLANQADVDLVEFASDSGDIRQLIRAIDSGTQAAENSDALWQDEGWWLVWPMAFLVLLGFRKGWVVKW